MAHFEARSRVTKKGQITIPSNLRKRYSIKAGSTVIFEPNKNAIGVRPVKDMMDSAGALAKYADSHDVLRDLLKSRKKSDYW